MYKHASRGTITGRRFYARVTGQKVRTKISLKAIQVASSKIKRSEYTYMYNYLHNKIHLQRFNKYGHVLPVVCMSSTTSQPSTTGTCNSSTESYDTDSQWIGVDLLSTYCITNSMSDFMEKPTKIRQLIKGINDAPC